MIKRHASFLASAFVGLNLLISPSVQAEPLQRVVSAGANITEIIVALNAQQQLIAVDSTSELPGDMALPVVGYHRRLSAEGLLALSPDSIIGSDEMGPDSSIAQLQQAGIAVHKLNSQSTIESLQLRIKQLAELMGHPQQGEDLQAQLNSQLNQLEQQAQTAKAANTLFFLSHDAKKLVAAGSETTANSIMELAGAVNLAKPHINSYKPLSDEAILSMQPELLLFSQRSLEMLGGVDGVLSSFPVLAATPAGKNKAIFAIDGHALVGGLGLASIDEAVRLTQRLQ
ncbi:hemin ABC transporter substrate-binding protein [Agarivorans sp. 1_MG-2023]|uniref:heme/hemin ABC transporter substrate-binding protein n=1 Tax=Agarivorans sp. 1_MG-2023 TaxID=3062634 RepID=UPI0026E18054|nr:ABC transporter substrate-binding protein [Agarivorans sp. 1_MG-2023]MDO6762833.1 ABC transporter substrate-binding protein [Agarivorans sp. 1_MG-2023]